MPSWDPAQYRKFAVDRERPIHDLLARVTLPAPQRIVDLGCGAGASTAALAARWPAAALQGIDSSANMLTAATQALPRIQFQLANIADWQPAEALDLIFANASLQWLPDHERLMPRLLGLLAPGGALAVQMPRNYEAASHRLMREIAAQPAWRDKLVDLRTLYPVATPEAYLRWLQPIAADCVLWETDYWMRLDGDNPVLEWVKGTGLRPYLDALDEPDRQRFLARYSDAVKAAYPPEPDGSTLFPFKRLFFVARRS